MEHRDAETPRWSSPDPPACLLGGPVRPIVRRNSSLLLRSPPRPGTCRRSAAMNGARSAGCVASTYSSFGNLYSYQPPVSSNVFIQRSVGDVQASRVTSSNGLRARALLRRHLQLHPTGRRSRRVPPSRSSNSARVRTASAVPRRGGGGGDTNHPAIGAHALRRPTCRDVPPAPDRDPARDPPPPAAIADAARRRLARSVVPSGHDPVTARIVPSPADPVTTASALSYALNQ